MGWFGGRLQRTSSKVAVVFGIVILVGALAQWSAPLLGQTAVARDFVIFGTALSAIGIVGVIVSIIVRALHNPAAATAADGGVSAGWYPDQQDPTLMRYYDGRSWTSATAPRQP